MSQRVISILPYWVVHSKNYTPMVSYRKSKSLPNYRYWVVSRPMYAQIETGSYGICISVLVALK